MIRLILFSVLLMPYVSSRNAKWFFNQGTVTSFIHKRMLVTSVVPSSCIVVDPSLPPCRNVRRMDIAPSQPTKILSTSSPEMTGPRNFELEGGEGRAQPAGAGGFWDYGWGGWAKTVTHTVLATQTIKAYDSDAMVSIVLKGCHPTTLPLKLSPCDEESKNVTHQIQRELHYTTES